jgi:hypothetical protein
MRCGAWMMVHDMNAAVWALRSFDWPLSTPEVHWLPVLNLLSQVSNCLCVRSGADTPGGLQLPKVRPRVVTRARGSC